MGSCAVLPPTSPPPGLHSFSFGSPRLSPPFPSQDSRTRVCSVDYSVGASLLPTSSRHLAYPSVRVTVPLGVAICCGLGHPAHGNGKCLSLPPCTQLGGGWGRRGSISHQPVVYVHLYAQSQGKPWTPMMAFTHPTTILMPKETQ